MDDRIFGDREKALEENYFRSQDAKLLEKLRQDAKLDELALALADKLSVDNPELLARTRELGVTADTAEAFLLVPLVQVAWGEGSVSKSERDAVLRLARERGLEESSPAYTKLVDWLATRPADELFDAALEVIKCGLMVLPLSDREERTGRILDACRKVAEASGSEIAHLLGLGDGVARDSASVLESIRAKLKAHD